MFCSEQGQLGEIALGPFPIGYGIYSWKERFHTLGNLFSHPCNKEGGLWLEGVPCISLCAQMTP